jgi:DNA-binding transcriptional ArsR family regulator
MPQRGANACPLPRQTVVESSFAIIAKPNRRAILSLLLSSERSVGEIERELRLRPDSGFPSASDNEIYLELLG